MTSLVIVESPAKANTIKKILGKEFSVKASIGHIKDLPKKTLGINVEEDFAPEYEVIPGKEKIIRELKKAAKDSDRIYLAPDPDREGEAIAYHIASEISGGKEPNGKIFRVAFNEITPSAVREAIKNPGKIDMNKVNAQQARRVLDRLVGYGLSPLLWRKVRRGLSAGRVQSVALRLTVEREREIESFNKEEYWSVNAEFMGEGPPKFKARLHRLNDALVIDRDAPEGKRFLLTTAGAAEEAADSIGKKTYSLASVEKKLRKRTPNPPFITSTLQQEAARKLRFTAKKTMLVAQGLYEGATLGHEGSVGLITYMRTDSVRVSPEAQKWAAEYVEGRFGKEYLPPKPPQYKSKATAQEAHEAIRPTYMERTPEDVKKYLSKDQHNLYGLIWNRFIASQMKAAELEQTTFDIPSEDKAALFRASGTVIRFEGFMALYTESKDEVAEEEEGGLLPGLKEGVRLSLLELKPGQHFTQPPPRYSEATLVKALEEKGIGRPSTYAAILSTIQERKYVAVEERRFSPTELGFLVNDLLVERFPELIGIGFTAKMEDELDQVESGKLKWAKVVNDFYAPFSRELLEATETLGKVRPKDMPTEETCEKCGLPMVIRWGRHGRFIACTGYPNCKNTRPLDEERPSGQAEATSEVCEKCGSPMTVKNGRFGKFLACSKYPECKSTRPIPTGVKCPLDGGDVVERRSKKGKTFWSCSNYPACKFASWHPPVNKPCPKCNAPILLAKRDKAGSTVLICQSKECGHEEEA